MAKFSLHQVTQWGHFPLYHITKSHVIHGQLPFPTKIKGDESLSSAPEYFISKNMLGSLEPLPTLRKAPILFSSAQLWSLVSRKMRENREKKKINLEPKLLHWLPQNKTLHAYYKIQPVRQALWLWRKVAECGKS